MCTSQFPVIAFGTGSTMKYKDVTDYVGQAIENGFSHIDTAQCMLPLTANDNAPHTSTGYQTESYVGLAIKESGLPRSSLYITSKYSGIGTSQQAIQQSLDKVVSSLTSYSTEYSNMFLKIGVSYLDLYLVHGPAHLPDFESGWREFEDMKKNGLARCALPNSNIIS